MDALEAPMIHAARPILTYRKVAHGVPKLLRELFRIAGCLVNGFAERFGQIDQMFRTWVLNED